MTKTYKDKKNECLGKNLQNYENVCDEKSVYELKPIQIDDFNEAVEKEVKEHVEKRKIKRREVAEKINCLKKENRKKIKKLRKKCGRD